MDIGFLSLKTDDDDMTASEKLKFKVNIAKAEFIDKFKDSINSNRRNDLGVRYLDEHRKEGYKYDTSVKLLMTEQHLMLLPIR